MNEYGNKAAPVSITVIKMFKKVTAGKEETNSNLLMFKWKN